MAKKPETVFKERVKRYLKTLPNVKSFKIQQVTINATPDFLICLNGHFVALELKQVGEHPTPLQLHRIHEVIDCGGTGLVVDANNFEKAKEILEELAFFPRTFAPEHPVSLH